MEKSFTFTYILLSSDSSFVIFVAALAMFIGGLLHEFGHWGAARLVGIRTARLTFQRPPLEDIAASRSLLQKMPVLGVDLNATEFLSVSIRRRQFVFAAGTVMDILVGLAVWGWYSGLSQGGIVSIGIMLGAAMRVCICWINILPLWGIRNDGWRMRHPNESS